MTTVLPILKAVVFPEMLQIFKELFWVQESQVVIDTKDPNAPSYEVYMHPDGK